MKKIFTIIVALFCSAHLYAQDVTYHDVNPDTTINYWEVFGVAGVDIWWHPTPEVVVRTWSTYEILSEQDSLPKALGNGDDISAASAGIWAKQDYKCLNCEGMTGNWKGVTDKYLGFRHKENGQFRYGWIRLSIPADAASFTIKDYATQSADNTGIKAGQVFGTGVNNLNGDSDVVLVVGNKCAWFSGLKGRADVQITDLTGRVVERRTVWNSEVIDMSAYSAGVYLFRIHNAGLQMAGKIMLN